MAEFARGETLSTAALCEKYRLSSRAVQKRKADFEKFVLDFLGKQFLRLRIMAQNIEGAISPLDAFLMRQKPIYPPKRWIQMPCSLSLPQQIEQNVIKENLLFAGIRKISSEVRKSSCIVHRCTVYDFIAKKEVKCRRSVDQQRRPPR